MKRILAIILVLMLCLSLAGIAEDGAPQGGLGGNPPEGMGEPPQGGPGGEPPQGGPGRDIGNPPDAMGGPGGMAEGDVASTGNATNINGTIDVKDGIVTADNNLIADIREMDALSDGLDDMRGFPKWALKHMIPAEKRWLGECEEARKDSFRRMLTFLEAW